MRLLKPGARASLPAEACCKHAWQRSADIQHRVTALLSLRALALMAGRDARAPREESRPSGRRCKGRARLRHFVSALYFLRISIVLSIGSASTRAPARPVTVVARSSEL